MIENLRMWVPYNEFIGDPESNNTTPIEVIEEWKDILGYEGIYKISSFGRIHSLDRIAKNGQFFKGVLKSVNINHRYAQVGLRKDGNKPVTKNVHRLVAEYFIPNPLNLPMVNHKMGNKKNPFYLDLEWCTGSENSKHSFKLGLSKVSVKSNQKTVLDLDTGIYYYSLGELSRVLQKEKAHVSNVIRNKKIKRYIYI